MKEVTYTVHIEPGEDHGYIAHFPALPGCHTQADTVEEAVVRAKEALEMFLDSMIAHGEALPREPRISEHVGFDLPLSASVFAR